MKKNKQINRRQFIKDTAVSTTAMSVPIILSDKIFGANHHPDVKTGLSQYHKTSGEVHYKCLFNHELLIVTDQENNSRQYIQSFIEKLKDTDVDAVMCCPTSWRANLFPSEVDPTWKNYSPDQPLSKFPAYDYIMRYLHSGGDPVKDTLDACRKYGKGFLISYRMNDHHHLDDLGWPTHTDFWRNHPEFWMADRDGDRYFNYMHPEVRDHYFLILQELCTNYDVDGIELDFQRSPKFFLPAEVEKGTGVMTSFVKRMREMLDRIGKERRKSLKLSVRVPHIIQRCSEVGLDVLGWDAAGLIDMINVSPYFLHTMEIDIEGYKAGAKNAKIFGEMHFITEVNRLPTGIQALRYTTIETYHATALNFFHRGVDGISLFNFDYIRDPNGWEDSTEVVPAEMRITYARGLKGITDMDYLKTVSKQYVISSRFASLKDRNENTIRLIIPDDTGKVKFNRAILRVEIQPTMHIWAIRALNIGVWLNGTRLEPFIFDGTELFKPVRFNYAYPLPEVLKFYSVPLDRIISGENEIIIKNLDKSMVSCQFRSLEIGLYR